MLERYSQDELQEYAEQIDIVEYIEQTEELHRRGPNYFINCPFHTGDDTPSLCIYPETQSWYCFGCGEGGNIFNWIMLKDGVQFNEAVERVVEILGVEYTPHIEAPSVQFLKSYQKKETPKVKQDFQRTILGWQKDYFDKYSDELPDEWLNEYMTPEALRFYNIRVDKTANRIVYPVTDSQGQFIGVKGRTRFNDYKTLGLQKYMNYQKIGTIDYFQGWEQALPELLKTRVAIIFEGIKSCIKSYGWGIRNTVASETDNLSEGQVKLLIQTGFDEIIFGWDTDKTPQSIASDQKIQMLKRFSKVSIITNKGNVLDNKMAPVDKGERIYKELLNERMRL